jgi:hypothetical protein
MDVFNEYLKGKKFILFTDHKPLEKMGHLHTKTMNRLQAALLEHDFVIQYQKEKSCQQTSYQDCLPHKIMPLVRPQRVLILSNWTSTTCKKRINNYKTLTISE